MPAKFYKNAVVLNRDNGEKVSKEAKAKIRNYYSMGFKENPVAVTAFKSAFNFINDINCNRYDLTNLPMYKFEQVFQMDQFMKDNPLPDDIVVFRAIKGAGAFQFNVGDVFGLSCYGSSSLNPAVALPSYCGNMAVFMQLKLPIHTPAAYLESVTEDEEDLLIIKRGVKYRVLEKEYDEYNPNRCILKAEAF